MSIIHKKDIKSPELRASIIEPILLSCIDGINNFELESIIKIILPLYYTTIKEYLFYLIDYELVSYNGKRRKFSIEYGGFGLLDMIDEEKRREKIGIDEIMITFECT
jgi:hypothetical protein